MVTQLRSANIRETMNAHIAKLLTLMQLLLGFQEAADLNLVCGAC